MNILVMDTSSVTACCGVVNDERKILSCGYVHVPLKHSQTFMPMTESVLACAGMTVDQIDLLAVCAGPGSFTGVRIATAAAKGLAFGRDIPCVAVSSLSALAHNFEGILYDGLLACVMDARCRQFYTACFECESGKITRVSPDEALLSEDAAALWQKSGRRVLFVGDGAEICFREYRERFPCAIAPPHLRYVTPYGIAAAAESLPAEGSRVSPQMLRPVYLRVPQAERELKEKRQNI